MKRLFIALFGFILTVMSVSAAQTETRLVVSASSACAGETIYAGVEFKMPEEWHIYWRNGGDAGTPTEIEWSLPPGVSAGEVLWPTPRKLINKEGDFTLVTYVYDDSVVLQVPLQLAKDLKPGNLEIKAKVNWQECKEICLTGHSEVSGNLTIGEENVPSADSALMEEWRKRVPVVDPSPKAWAALDEPAAGQEGRSLIIEWTPKTLGDPKQATADFYPFDGKNYDLQHITDQSWDAKDGKFMVRKTMTSSGEWPSSIRGLLVLIEQDRTIANEVTLRIGEPKSAEKIAGAAGKPATFWMLLQMTFFAFVGGLVLNFMPCVLPVISLKVLGLVSEARQEPGRLLRLGLVYGIGVLVSFAILAVASIAIQKAGGIADWGAAFRNPQFRVIITIVITLVALNLFGLFEITLSGKAMNAAGDLTGKHGYPGAFFNGMLATLLATPCTAPFLSVAIIFAFTQPPAVTLWIFLWVGIGLAFPFVLVCWKPWLLKFLPKPGVWMERFKVGMGFPMLLTAVWLFSLTGTRLGKDGVLWFGIFLVLLAFVAWMWGQFVQRESKHKWILVLTSLALLLFGYQYILEGKLKWRNPTAVAKSSEKIEWQPWSKESVEKARKEGHPVLVDFTADSCLNCQFNKLTSLEIEPTRAKLKEIGAVAFLADYTDENPAIAKELAHFQRAGVPLVVVYPSDLQSEPIVLPPLLTPAIVLKALDTVSAKNSGSKR